MEVDDERKMAVTEQAVTVDATKVEEEEEEEEATLWADVGGEETLGTKRSGRGAGEGS